MLDRRMAISALCPSEPEDFQPPTPVATAAEGIPPLAPSCSPAKSSDSIGKTPSKKRSRRLSNSERGKLYRSRRKNYVQSLEEQVEQLKKEVDELSLHGKSARFPLCRQPGGAAFAQVVSEYFSLFKYGVSVSGSADSRALLSSQQGAFLHELMHPNMVFGQTYGVQELLSQWEKYSLYHAGLKYEVKNLQIMAADPNPVVRARATLSVRFTRRTIEKIFPHMLWNEALVQRLVGTQLEYHVGDTFYFGDDNKIHRYDTYVDFAAAFVRVLGSLEDTMAMMQSALIRQESMIGDLLEDPPCIKTEAGYSRVEVVESNCSSSSESTDGQPRVLPSVAVPYRMSLQSIL